MQTMTVYLMPHSSFRGGSPPRSDTLFGAICWGYRLLFGEDRLVMVLKNFKRDSVPFLVSSTFPYTEYNDVKTHILPKPLADPSPITQSNPTFEELKTLKRLKKRKSVTDKEFSALINGERYQIDLSQKQARVQGMQIPHSSINRLTGTVEGARFFYTEECSPLSEEGVKAGLFFCVKYNDELAKDLKTVFHFLGDKGIGGDASVGKGHAKEIDIVDELPYIEPPPEEASHVITLSLTVPDAKLRAQLSNSWYHLEKRQGKIESMYTSLGADAHIWKDHLLMLKEGSTFPKNGQPCYGENRIVRKDDRKLGFDVQHYGYAFTVNTKHISQKE